MFNYIKGTLVEKKEGSVVIECNGIGFDLIVSNHTLNNLPEEGSKVSAFTYFQVKDDGFVLFGFLTKPEKEVFLKLITVSGIGPKMASTILSGITPNELISAVLTQNLALLGSIKGIGKKTAERLLLELKSKIDSVAGGIDPKALNIALPDAITEQAVTVLIDWGVNRTDAYKLVVANYSQNDTLEELISKTLRNMGR